MYDSNKKYAGMISYAEAFQAAQCMNSRLTDMGNIHDKSSGNVKYTQLTSAWLLKNLLCINKNQYQCKCLQILSLSHIILSRIASYVLNLDIFSRVSPHRTTCLELRWSVTDL